MERWRRVEVVSVTNPPTRPTSTRLKVGVTLRRWAERGRSTADHALLSPPHMQLQVIHWRRREVMRQDS